MAEKTETIGNARPPKKSIKVKVNKKELISLIQALPVHEWFYNFGIYNAKEDKYHWDINSLNTLYIEDLYQIYRKCKEEIQNKPVKFYLNRQLEKDKKCEELAIKLEHELHSKRRINTKERTSC